MACRGDQGRPGEVRRSDTLPRPSRLRGEISPRSGEARLPQQHAPARAGRRPVLLLLAAAHRVAPVSQEAHGHDEDRVRREPAGVRPLERALVEQTLDEQHQRHQHRERRAPDGGNAQLKALPAPSKAQGRRELRTAQGTEAAWDACPGGTHGLCSSNMAAHCSCISRTASRPWWPGASKLASSESSNPPSGATHTSETNGVTLRSIVLIDRTHEAVLRCCASCCAHAAWCWWAE